jgi:hypothetical protein
MGLCNLWVLSRNIGQVVLEFSAVLSKNSAVRNEKLPTTAQ